MRSSVDTIKMIHPDSERRISRQALKQTKNKGRFKFETKFIKKDGSWSKPVNMGKAINTPQIEDGAYVSPDGKYLFFNIQG